MKKVILFSTALFLSVALLNSCGNKEESKEDGKEETKKEEAVEESNDDSEVSESSTGWGEMERKAYMDACVNGAKSSIGEEKAESYCSCTMEKIMALYPSALDLNDIDATEKNDIIMKVAEECMADYME